MWVRILKIWSKHDQTCHRGGQRTPAFVLVTLISTRNWLFWKHTSHGILWKSGLCSFLLFFLHLFLRFPSVVSFALPFPGFFFVFFFFFLSFLPDTLPKTTTRTAPLSPGPPSAGPPSAGRSRVKPWRLCGCRLQTTTRELQTCTFQAPGASKTPPKFTRRHQESEKKREFLGPPQWAPQLLPAPPFNSETLSGPEGGPHRPLKLKFGVAQTWFGQNWFGQTWSFWLKPFLFKRCVARARLPKVTFCCEYVAPQSATSSWSAKGGQSWSSQQMMGEGVAGTSPPSE